MSRTSIDFFDLLVVFEGELHLWEDGKIFSIKEKEFLILEPNKKHYGLKPSTVNTHYFWLHFGASGPHSNSEFESPSFNIATDGIHTLSIQKFGKLIKTQKIYNFFEALTDLHTYSNSLFKQQQQIIFHQLIHELITQTHKETTSDTPSDTIINIAEQAAYFLEKNFHLEITYETLSEHLNFNCVYISRCFKKIYGITPLDYLKKIRLKEAEFNLIHTDHSIDKIASFTGFNSTSYFSKQFTKTYGLSPSLYRKRMEK